MKDKKAFALRAERSNIMYEFYEKEELTKALRHIATYYDVYRMLHGKTMKAKEVKRTLVKRGMPESTARMHIKELKKNECDLIFYYSDEDEFMPDEDAMSYFLNELDYLVYRPKKESERSR
jgi:hypothetical protein